MFNSPAPSPPISLPSSLNLSEEAEPCQQSSIHDVASDVNLSGDAGILSQSPSKNAGLPKPLFSPCSLTPPESLQSVEQTDNDMPSSSLQNAIEVLNNFKSTIKVKDTLESDDDDECVVLSGVEKIPNSDDEVEDISRSADVISNSNEPEHVWKVPELPELYSKRKIRKSQESKQESKKRSRVLSGATENTSKKVKYNLSQITDNFDAKFDDEIVKLKEINTENPVKKSKLGGTGEKENSKRYVTKNQISSNNHKHRNCCTFQKLTFCLRSSQGSDRTLSSSNSSAYFPESRYEESERPGNVNQTQRRETGFPERPEWSIISSGIKSNQKVSINAFD